MTTIIPRPGWVTEPLIESRGIFAQFQMYTAEGNGALGFALDSLLRKADADETKTRRQFIESLQALVVDVRRIFPEVYDTEPEWAVVDAVNGFMDKWGWARIDRDDLS